MHPLHLLIALQSCAAFMMPISRSQLIGTGTSIVAGISTALTYPKASVASDEDQQSPELERSNNRIYFYTGVTGSSCAMLRRAIADATLESQMYQITFSQPEPVPIELHIQSPGGSLMHAFGVVDLIQRNPVPIHSYIDGYAASAATLMSVVCERRFAYPNSLMLLHQLSGEAQGKFADVVEDVDNMTLMMNMCKRIYLEHTLMREKELDEVLSHDVWFSAQTCIDKGIIDTVL